jgi:hypothetical protein
MGTWPPNFKKMIENELLTMGIQQIKNLFSIVVKNCMLGLIDWV